MSKKGLITKINEKAEASPYVPSGKAIIQSVISSIPFVGSALDHLLFDKADQIRLKNIEKTLDEIKNKVNLFDEIKISKEWFGSAECMQMFKLLIEKTQIEPDENKISNLAKIFVKSGLKEFENDPNKFAVMMRVSEMTFVQQKLLQVIDGIPPIKRTSTGGSIQFTTTAIWFSQIMETLKTGSKFWSGVMQLNEELGILETFNMIKNVPLGTDELGYNMTALGKLVTKYLSDK